MTNEIRPVDSVLDLAEAMSNMDGDAELLQEIVAIFLEAAVAQLDSIDQGIQSQNSHEVAIQAHAMKGGASNFCARKFVASAMKLEMLAKGGCLDGADQMLAMMRSGYEEIVEVARVINWTEVERNWNT